LTYFTGLVGVLVGIIIPIFVWQSPKGRCYGNQLNLEDFCRRRQQLPLPFALAFDNGFTDYEAAFKRLNGNNLATLCTNLVNFPFNNLGVFAVKMCNFCRDSAAI